MVCPAGSLEFRCSRSSARGLGGGAGCATDGCGRPASATTAGAEAVAGAGAAAAASAGAASAALASTHCDTSTAPDAAFVDEEAAPGRLPRRSMGWLQAPKLAIRAKPTIVTKTPN